MRWTDDYDVIPRRTGRHRKQFRISMPTGRTAVAGSAAAVALLAGGLGVLLAPSPDVTGAGPVTPLAQSTAEASPPLPHVVDIASTPLPAVASPSAPVSTPTVLAPPAPAELVATSIPVPAPGAMTSGPAPAPSADPPLLAAEHPGADCTIEGATAVAGNGNEVVCDRAGERLRWRTG